MNNELNSLIDKKLSDFKKTNLGFRTWRKFDGVTDSFSPITPASRKASFFGTVPITKPTVTGSRGANAALTSLLTQLANLGLIIDSSS